MSQSDKLSMSSPAAEDIICYLQNWSGREKQYSQDWFNFRCNWECLIVLDDSKDFWRTLSYCFPERKKGYPTLRYRVLSGESFKSPIFFLQLLLAGALSRRLAWHRVPLGDPRQTVINDSSKVILSMKILVESSSLFVVKYFIINIKTGDLACN